MTTEHTPGTWAAKTETMESARAVLDDLERLLYAGGPHNFTITTVVAPDNLPTPPPEWSNGQVVVAYLGNGPTGPANAHLIAAAPDMFKACDVEGLLDTIAEGIGLEPYRGGNNRVIDKANDALAILRAQCADARAKAKGGAR